MEFWALGSRRFVGLMGFCGVRCGALLGFRGFVSYGVLRFGAVGWLWGDGALLEWFRGLGWWGYGALWGWSGVGGYGALLGWRWGGGEMRLWGDEVMGR